MDKNELKTALTDWMEKVVTSYNPKHGEMVDTYQMIVDVEKIIAEAFNR